MTPAKLKRKTKNRLLSSAKGAFTLIFGVDSTVPHEALDQLHDFAMRCYAEGYTHGEAAGREKEESKL